MKERLQKLIAASGLCSRRAAEEWIIRGKVTVNGGLARLGDTADPAADRICVDGQPLPAAPEKSTTILLYKPRGVVTTMHDERGRPTVAELGELIRPEDLPLLKLELINAIVDAMPAPGSQEYDPNAVDHALHEGHQRAMYVDVMHRPEGEFWASTNKELTQRIDCYLEASGQKEAPVKVRRYGEIRQGEESI